LFGLFIFGVFRTGLDKDLRLPVFKLRLISVWTAV